MYDPPSYSRSRSRFRVRRRADETDAGTGNRDAEETDAEETDADETDEAPARVREP